MSSPVAPQPAPVPTPESAGYTADSLIRSLEGHPAFAALGQTSLTALVAKSPVDRFAEGEFLFRQGDVGEFAYLVLEGQVTIDVDTPFGMTSVATIEPGRLVGEIGAFSDTLRTASVIARSNVGALRLEQATIRAVIAAHPEVAMKVIGELGRRIQEINGPMALFTHAAEALKQGTFAPAMLDELRQGSNQFGHFARAFEDMAAEITAKHSQREAMQTAADIQRAFLPRVTDVGSFAGHLDLFADMLPALDIGGDFYDFFSIDDDRLGFLIADVSGKGTPAALFMAMARTTIRAVASRGVAAGECMREANRQLARDNEEAMFVTVFYGDLDVSSGALRFCNAGHDPTLVLGADRRLRELAPEGPALGMLDDFDYRTCELRLGPGDGLFLYTDGVTEAFDVEHNMFGQERLREVIGRYRFGDLGAEQLVRLVTGAVADFTEGAEPSDDITCLALLYAGLDS